MVTIAAPRAWALGTLRQRSWMSHVLTAGTWPWRCCTPDTSSLDVGVSPLLCPVLVPPAKKRARMAVYETLSPHSRPPLSSPVGSRVRSEDATPSPASPAQLSPAQLGVRAHSTRGVASSWALARGASIADICKAADWATPNTFARFYNLRIEPVSSRVLVSDGQ